jgi:hypothetical protein
VSRAVRLSGVVAALATAATLGAQPIRPVAGVPTPAAHTGLDIGADRVLADWPQITAYFDALAKARPQQMKLDTLGLSTQGKPFVVAAISSPRNIARLEAIRAAQARLADPRGLSAADEARLVAEQPVVVFVSCNLHSNEIGASQMAMELAYRLTTVDTLQRRLENVVIMLVPSMNPDGQQMITDWYRQGVGTPFEGGPLPWLYHVYTGHDNNRDWFMVTQQETKLVTDVLYRRWFPQVFYDVHQQGNRGMRMTVPPHVDPINPNVDPLLVRGINLIGMQMQYALEAEGKTGVGDGVTYDLWWHGGARSTPTRHNMVGLLTEAASANIATPVTQRAEELTGHPRGLPTYERKVNFPNPWLGGTWRLRDIMDYERIAAEALLELASTQRESFVRNHVQVGRKQLALGASEAPYAYVIPSGQRDPSAVQRLVEVLRLGGVEVSRATAPFRANGREYAAGAYVVDLAQPFRAHAKDLLEVQRFPRIQPYAGGPVEPPYDVAGWTLPMQLGVVAEPVTDAPLRAVNATPITALHDRAASCSAVTARGPVAIDLRDTRAYSVLARALGAGVRARRANAPVTTRDGQTLPAGTVVLDRLPSARALGDEPVCGHQVHAVTRMPAGESVRAPRIALYKPWTANMDEGWTRWVFEQHGVPFTTLTDSMVRAGNLKRRFDVIVVPDMPLVQMQNGLSSREAPAPYAGGLGEDGLAALAAFTRGGGTLVLLDHASEFAVERLGAPVRLIAGGNRTGEANPGGDQRAVARARTTPYAPGSILRTLVNTRHVLGTGASDTTGVYFTNSVTFDVAQDAPVEVVARYPEGADDLLMSGYLDGAESIARLAAMVRVPAGEGHAVLFGFRPQHRAQAYGTFRLLFNALYFGGVR